MPTAIVCDLDSTLALTHHRSHLSPRTDPSFTWIGYSLMCRVDEPNKGVATLLRFLAEAGYYIIYVSCREPQAEAATSEWLETHDIPCDSLYLLGSADIGTSPDSFPRLVSRKADFILDLRLSYDIALVLDDYVAVRDYLAPFGIPTLVVEPGYPVGHTSPEKELST